MNLSQLQQTVQNIYPNAVYPVAYKTVTDASGNTSISFWNDAVGPQPTTDQLNTAWNSMQLSQAKEAKTISVTASYNGVRWGVPVTITSTTGSSFTFPTDSLTQTNITGYIAAYAIPGSVSAPSGGLPLLDINEAVQMLSVADIQALAGAIASASIAAFTKYKSLLSEIAAATTVTDVQSVTWS